MSFGSKLPAVPAPIPPPPPPPQLPDAISASATKAAMDGAKTGVASTISTGPQGLTDQAKTATKSLLGS